MVVHVLSSGAAAFLTGDAMPLTNTTLDIGQEKVLPFVP
jgi:hypothetical protein